MGNQSSCARRSPAAPLGWATAVALAALLAGIALEVQAAAAQPRTPARPETGTFIVDGPRAGDGELIIENGNDVDGLVVLTTPDDVPVLAVYVRAGTTFTVTGIEDGTYYLYAVLGEGWDPAGRTFARVREAFRFDELLEFETTADQYTSYTVTLHDVIDGNAPTTPVPAGSVPVQ
jgi:hypothetical protein